jgi:putative nucleotidyltransferase with HDIG domain
MLVDMRQVVLAIASAVDLVGIDDVLHGRRVGVMAAECAKTLGWDRNTQDLLFDAGLLHDCGVSSTRVHRALVDNLDWQDAHIHCEKGEELLRRFAPLARLAPIIRYHHTHWEELLARTVPPDTARYANLIYLANAVDASAGPYYNDSSLLLRVEELHGLIARRRDTLFAPDLVDAFLATSRAEAFWLQLNPDFIPQYVAEMGCFAQMEHIDISDLKQFALTIAAIVDAKSHFTTEHSLGVARLTRFLATQIGITGERLDLVEVAALLHDIGKLQIPDEVLESPEKLTLEERAMMKKHSFATYQILKRIVGFETLARWASQHHESLDGNGYPFHLLNGDIPLESRIIKIADVFQALAQDRPYRGPMAAKDILEHLRSMQAGNEVDASIVDIVAENLSVCHGAAVGP